MGGAYWHLVAITVESLGCEAKIDISTRAACRFCLNMTEIQDPQGPSKCRLHMAHEQGAHEKPRCKKREKIECLVYVDRYCNPLSSGCWKSSVCFPNETHANASNGEDV